MGSKYVTPLTQTALALARSGHGAALAAAFRAHFSSSTPPAVLAQSHASWDAALGQWRERVAHELATNTNKHLRRRQPALATRMQATAFLGDARARARIYAYVWPRTSERTPQRAQLERLVAQRGRMALDVMAREAQALFAWAPTAVLARFERLVWPGAYIRYSMAAQAAPTDQGAGVVALGPPPVVLQGRQRKGSRKEVRIRYSVQPFVQDVCEALGLPVRGAPTACMWVPTAFLARPDPAVRAPCLAEAAPQEASEDEVQLVAVRLREVVVLDDTSTETIVQ